MDYFNYLIIGSGPAGIAAARRLEGKGTCIVDIGEMPENDFPYKSLIEALAADDYKAILGPKWETLENLVKPGSIHPKLRASGIRYVMRGQEFQVYGSNRELCMRGACSHAAGGMSNAWGAQLFRYTNIDLSEAGNWPIDAEILDSFYPDLEEHIGIAGMVDDVYSFLGESRSMLPPAPIVPSAEYLLRQYSLRKGRMLLGRSRLAVLTRAYRGYPEYGFNETEFLTTEQPGLYTARRSLKELRTYGRVTYLDHHELVGYKELPDFVEVNLRHCETNAQYILRTKHLLLGCGAQQTARLVLLNKGAIGKPLPFIDHPPTLIPIFIPRMFGTALPLHSFPVQLVATMAGADEHDMISLYYPGSLLWSDLIADIPLPINVALKLLPNLLGGMLVAQIWEPSRPEPQNKLCLESSSSIRIDYPVRTPYQRLGAFISALRSLGAYSHKRLATMAPPGWGFHYAGCLPMRRHPQEYETHIDGRLWDSRRVRIIDGSVLPSLPAKNHSFTLMANSARIAQETLQCGY